jgi:hypothetical protein
MEYMITKSDKTNLITNYEQTLHHTKLS